VRKGEKGTQIVFYKKLRDPRKNANAIDEAQEQAPFVLCYYTVVNLEQCDGLTLPEIEEPIAKGEVETDQKCESM
jgi:antirestriction protein ArdC